AYGAGWVRERMKAPAGAESAYARVAVRYPGSSFGQAARDTLVARRKDAAESAFSRAARDTTNVPFPKPKEAIADSIAQAALADSLRKAAFADSVRRVTLADSLARAFARRAAQVDSPHLVVPADTARHAPAL